MPILGLPETHRLVKAWTHKDTTANNTTTITYKQHNNNIHIDTYTKRDTSQSKHHQHIDKST